MKYIILKITASVLILFSTQYLNAQVGVLTTAPQVTVQVESVATVSNIADGIIAPRLTRAQLVSKDAQYGVDQTDAIVYVTIIDGVVSPQTTKIDRVGHYYFDGIIWQRMDELNSYFYLPIFELPTQTVGVNRQFNLYTNVISKQFTKSGNTDYYTNNEMLAQLPPAVLAATDYDYVITYYDKDIIKVNSISAAGVVNYDVLVSDTRRIGLGSFLNIVVLVR